MSQCARSASTQWAFSAWMGADWEATATSWGKDNGGVGQGCGFDIWEVKLVGFVVDWMWWVGVWE